MDDGAGPGLVAGPCRPTMPAVLWTNGCILLMLWALGYVAGGTVGQWVHLLLGLALLHFALGAGQGRTAPAEDARDADVPRPVRPPGTERLQPRLRAGSDTARVYPRPMLLLAVPLLLLLAAPDAGPPPLLEELPPGAPNGVASAVPRAPLIRRVAVNPRQLGPELRALAQEASRSGARVLVELGAPWCEPCRALDAAFSRESNRALLSGWWLVEVNVDALPPGPVLGRSTHTLPALVRLDGSGHPEAWLQGAALPTDNAARLDAALRGFLPP